MGKINKKKVIITIITVILIAVFVVGITIISNNIKINNQMKTATHAITIENEVKLYTSKNKTKEMTTLDIGTDTYILETVTNKNGEVLYKIKTGKKVGYVSKKDVGYYKEANNEKELMVDVSQFNLNNNFKSIGQFKAFLIKNDIKYVYIRAGGRGYGKAGKFYFDDNYKEYAEACEYLKIPFGFYFLEEAISSSEVDEEVKFMEDFLDENKYEYNKLPVALDVEKHVETGRADDIWETRYELVNELITKLKKKKINSILYSNAVLANTYLTRVNAKMWLAYYPGIKQIPTSWDSMITTEDNKSPEILKKVIGWQFTETGVSGKIDEKLDISLVAKDFYKTQNLEIKNIKLLKGALNMLGLE